MGTADTNMEFATVKKTDARQLRFLQVYVVYKDISNIYIDNYQNVQSYIY